MLHIAIFPFLAHGHQIPALDIAKLLATRKVRVTLTITPLNAGSFTIGHHLISLEVFNFPAKQAGLPYGCENVEQIMMEPELVPKFLRAVDMLEEQLESFLGRARPDCLIGDCFYHWATACARKFNIPRIVFHGMGYFPLCAQQVLSIYRPYKNNVSSENGTFKIPVIPHDVRLLPSQMSPELRDENNPFYRKRMEMIKESETESHGVLVNSFYELESAYDLTFAKLGRRSRSIGPVSLCNRSTGEKTIRGKAPSIDENTCRAWLDSKAPRSVIYVCFGSTTNFTTRQLDEIAAALELSGKAFVWVIKNEWKIPQGFEGRMLNRGLLIRGWAPQMVILEHKAVGTFMTHCGWNSTIEGISAGVPLVTWPNFAEQFYNEKLVTEILQIGVSVGSRIWSRVPTEDRLIGRGAIGNALMEIMEGPRAEQMRNRVEELKVMACKAMEEDGGSSHKSLSIFLNEMEGFRSRRVGVGVSSSR